jgi:hypothetical protein
MTAILPNSSQRPKLTYHSYVQDVNMARRVKVPISTARARLFQLTELVRSSADETVVIFQQRGGRESVALVREARLAYLEARVGELEKRDRQPFKLAGSLASDLDDDALAGALREIRREWAPRTNRPGAPRRSPAARRRGR